jgi:hypothetical protein
VGPNGTRGKCRACPAAMRSFGLQPPPPLTLNFQVGSDWPVAYLRHEVQIAMGSAAPTDFYFVVVEQNKVDRKVNRRREKIMTVSDVMPPRALQMKSSDP